MSTTGTEFVMTRTIGPPVPDCATRANAALIRRGGLEPLTRRRGSGVTAPNGEEIDYGLGFAASYHKGLPHGVDGTVHCPSYHALVRALSGQEVGAIETLPIGANRRGAGTVEDPVQHTTDSLGAPHGYRKLTSPFTGHVFDTEGADAGALAISAAPRFDSDELAAEMAELYAMALLRDVPFTAIADDSGANVTTIVQALASMPWFKETYVPVSDPERRLSDAERRRFESRAVPGVEGGAQGGLASGYGLFRGSTPGSKNGPWLSQFLLGGSANAGFRFAPPQANTAEPSFVGTRSRIGEEDGFVLYGTQVIDQRSIVAVEGVDYMTNWAAWLDCQNGVDFNGLERFRNRRRYLTTPRDIATYVHYDALYQAYHVACLRMLGDRSFVKDRGLPETSSRTRAAFASFGGPHVLALVTEVSTRALKAVWRQKWMHHRRTRPEVVAAWLTLHENDPARISDPTLAGALTSLRAKIPQTIFDLVAAHNTAQNAISEITPKPSLPSDFPTITNDKNFLLPMAFPEGSPTHPSYGAGHATVAGACVTVLKAFFEMFKADGETERPWTAKVFVTDFQDGPGGNANEGGELVEAPGAPKLTIQGELDKLAMNVANARDMAGVHYYTDYYESLRLGERIAVSIIEDHLSMYGEPGSMTFTSFDGDRIRISSNGESAVLQVRTGGSRSTAETWYERYAN